MMRRRMKMRNIKGLKIQNRFPKHRALAGRSGRGDVDINMIMTCHDVMIMLQDTTVERTLQLILNLYR